MGCKVQQFWGDVINLQTTFLLQGFHQDNSEVIRMCFINNLFNWNEERHHYPILHHICMNENSTSMINGCYLITCQCHIMSLLHTGDDNIFNLRIHMNSIICQPLDMLQYIWGALDIQNAQTFHIPSLVFFPLYIKNCHKLHLFLSLSPLLSLFLVVNLWWVVLNWTREHSSYVYFFLTPYHSHL